MADTHDVQMPDGTIVRGVPVGTTKAQLLAKLNGSGRRTNLAGGAYAIDRNDRLGPEIHNKLDAGDLFAHNYTAGLDVPATGLADVLANALRAPFSDKVDFRPRAVFQRGQRARREDIAAARATHPYASIPAEVAGAVTSLPGRAGTAALGALGRVRGGVGSLTSGVSDLAARAGPLARSTLDALGWGSLMGANEGGGGVKGGTEAAAGNIVGNLAFKGAGRVVSPLMSRSPEALRAAGRQLTPRQEAVRTLHSIGTEVSPGQIGDGAVRKIEDAVATVPFLGAPQRAAHRRSLESFNLAAINRAIAPVGSLPKGTRAGRQAITAAQKITSDAYDNALNSMSSPMDDQFHADLADALDSASLLPDDLRQTYDTILKRHVTPFVGSDIKGRDLQSIKRGLDKQIAAFENSTAPRDNLLVEPLTQARDAFMSNAQRNAPDLFAQYRKADAAYRNMAPINLAAAANKKGGVITPFQFASGVSRRGHGTTTNALARGQANGQDIAEAANLVLPAEMKSSGTAERASILGLLGGGTAAAPFVPKLALAGAALSAPYAPPVSRAYQAYRLGQRPKIFESLANRLELAAPQAGIALAPLIVNGGQ